MSVSSKPRASLRQVLIESGLVTAEQLKEITPEVDDAKLMCHLLIDVTASNVAEDFQLPGGKWSRQSLNSCAH